VTFLNNQDQIRSIEFGRSYLWDFLIDGAPPPFDRFFPAIEITETTAVLESRTFEVYGTSIEIPMRGNVRRVEITFVDDEAGTGLNFFTNWISNEILRETARGGITIATLQEASKRIIVEKLNARRETLKQNTYMVFPRTELQFQGNSESGGVIYQIPLVVTGVIQIDELGAAVAAGVTSESETTLAEDIANIFS